MKMQRQKKKANKKMCNKIECNPSISEVFYVFLPFKSHSTHIVCNYKINNI